MITGVLRDQMGYDGLIMTDALDMNAVDLNFNYYDAVVMAINAGVDLLATGPSIGQHGFEAAMQRVVDEVRAGNISEDRIDQSVRRILEAKQKYGILDWQPLDPTSAPERVNLEAHAQFVDELYQKGVTVAYDRNNLIPIPPDRKVAMIFLATRYQIQNECAPVQQQHHVDGRRGQPDAGADRLGGRQRQQCRYGGGVDAERGYKPGTAAVGQRAAAGKNHRGRRSGRSTTGRATRTSPRTC